MIITVNHARAKSSRLLIEYFSGKDGVLHSWGDKPSDAYFHVFDTFQGRFVSDIVK